MRVRADLRFGSPLTRIRYYSHTNIIKYCKRPFLTDEQSEIAQKLKDEKCAWRDYDAWSNVKLTPEQVEEHDQTLIDNHNKVVQKGDRVYHLGDFAFCEGERAHEILDQLNGQIHFVYGNHDKVIRKNKSVQQRFAWCKDYFELKVSDPDAEPHKRKVILSHYAFEVWNKSHHGSWHLAGHSHNTLNSIRYNTTDRGQRLDVGVDAVAYWLAEGDENNLQRENYRPISYDEVKQIMATKEFVPIDHHGKDRASA